MKTGEIVAFISGRSGVGKTTTIVNIAHQLANLGHSVCIIDMDMIFGELHISMGLEQFYDNKKTLYHVLKNYCTLEECLIRNNDNICLLPSSRNLNINSEIDMSNLSSIITSLSEKFNYVLLDIPSDLGTISFFNINHLTINKIIFISSHNLSSITNTDTLVEYFELNNFTKEMYLIITNYIEELNSEDESISLSNICEVLKIPLLGVVSYNKDIIIDINKGINNLAHKKSLNYKEYEIIVERLCCNTELINPTKKDKRSKGFLSNPFSKKHPKKYIV